MVFFDMAYSVHDDREHYQTLKYIFLSGTSYRTYLCGRAATRYLIALAGMDGALPGVLAGLVCCPVLAVPTSVGYGIGAGGFAALSTMLSTCVPGVATLNIDNGFGAAAFAAKLLNKK